MISRKQKLISLGHPRKRQSTMLPQLFAINTDLDGRISIFQARICHDGRGRGSHYDPWTLGDIPYATYRISPYRIHTGTHERLSAFVLEGRFGSSIIPSDDPVILYNDDYGPPVVRRNRPRPHYEDVDDPPHDSIYRGNWRYSGYTVFSMYCATPIPILVFTDNESIEWPAPHYNRMSVDKGDRAHLRIWAQHWNPVTWETASHVTRRSATVTITLPPPKFVIDLIIADAIAKRTVCPITMEPLKADRVTVTSCYHVFDTNALNTWAADTNVCPQCRKGL